MLHTHKIKMQHMQNNQLKKKELQKKKKKAKKEREFQAEYQSLWKVTVLFISTCSWPLAQSQARKKKFRPEIIPEDTFFSFEESNSESKSDFWMFAPPSFNIKTLSLRYFYPKRIRKTIKQHIPNISIGIGIIDSENP